MKKYNTTKDTLRKKFITLIGNNDAIYTFEFCSTRGYDLDNSTIDKVEVWNDDVRFVYDEDTNDYAYLDQFNLDELAEFYFGLVDYILDDSGDLLSQDILCYLLAESKSKVDIIIDCDEDDYNSSNRYKNVPTSDLFQLVAEECQKETILDMAEQFIGKASIRTFLYACLGLDIE